MEPLAVRIRSSNRVARQLNERSRETLGFETQAERDLMLVLHRPIEPTEVKRTSRYLDRMSVSDPKWTS